MLEFSVAILYFIWVWLIVYFGILAILAFCIVIATVILSFWFYLIKPIVKFFTKGD